MSSNVIAQPSSLFTLAIAPNRPSTAFADREGKDSNPPEENLGREVCWDIATSFMVEGDENVFVAVKRILKEKE